MSHFDKFMKDIEKKQQQAQKQREAVSKDDDQHLQRERVRRYTERWQNSVRWLRRGSKNES